ncbi:MAG: hypothetical protein KME17_19990 [Cyanosarcina radialis HA8281-LM2]|jgi:predicted nucleic acid-binding protein|nr:hypothetical protein [Cyanosarcina radialis HA8281-LM2]
MHLVIDANVLIAELLRQRGRELISSPSLSLHASDKILNEASYELKQRLERLVAKDDLLPKLERFC